MNELIAMGFDEACAQAALRRTNDNLDLAIDFLLSDPAGLPTPGSDRQVCSDRTPLTNAQTNVNDFVERLPYQDQAQTSGSGVLISLGVSQYTFGESGASACTVIAGTMLKMLLERLRAGVLPTDVTELSEAVWSGVAHYQSLPPAMRNHLAIDELGPYMTETLDCKAALQGLLSTRNHFEDLFAQARVSSGDSKHIGIVITKPPETVCVILPPANCSPATRKYILFDSHSRPQLGLSGSYMFVSDDQREIVRRLDGLFPPLPMERGGTADYMQEMYNMFEGSVFQYKS